MSNAEGKDLQKFIATAVHALRSPLSRIYCAGQELRENYGEALDETGRFFVQSVCEASEEVEDLLTALSDLSRFHGVKPSITNVDVAAIAVEETEVASTEFPSLHVHLKAPASAVIRADDCLMRKAIRELIKNAVKFSSRVADPVVELRVKDTDGGWEISVSDNGVGFDSFLAERLFFPFQRLHRKNGLSGKGVGLAIVKAVASAHGGWVSAEGAIDAGATFSFFVPRQK